MNLEMVLPDLKEPSFLLRPLDLIVFEILKWDTQIQLFIENKEKKIKYIKKELFNIIM